MVGRSAAPVAYIMIVIEHARHVPIRSLPRSDRDVCAAINDIVADALEHFDCEQFRPAHPLDRDLFLTNGLQLRPTGMIWAIDYLGRVGATEKRFDVRPFLSRLLDASRALQPLYQEYAVHGSLLVGDLGTAPMVMGGHSQSKPHHVALAPSQYLSVCSLAAPSQ
jgi:hypothetical protein